MACAVLLQDTRIPILSYLEPFFAFPISLGEVDLHELCERGDAECVWILLSQDRLSAIDSVRAKWHAGPSGLLEQFFFLVTVSGIERTGQELYSAYKHTQFTTCKSQSILRPTTCKNRHPFLAPLVLSLKRC